MELKCKTISEFISDHDDISLSNSAKDLSNLFLIVQKGQNSYYNIYNTLNIANSQSISTSYYTNYKVLEGDTWTNISYKFYNTIKLWWLICKFNNITCPFTELKIGMILKIPTTTFMNQLIELISQ